MKRNRLMWAGIVLAIGVLQGWDSGVLRSTAGVQTLVALAMAAATAAVALTNDRSARAAMVAAAFVLLTVARIVAPTPLPTLHLIAFVPALILLGPLAPRQSATM